MRYLFLSQAMTFIFGAAVYTPARNQPALVHLRIEGLNYTIYEASVLTTGHAVSTVSGGMHHCDGTNGGAHPQAGPTCTSALDDAAALVGFQWDGSYNSSFDDYFVTSIGDRTQTLTQYWGIIRNYQFIPVGGCQQQVRVGDEVLFAFDAYKVPSPHILKLSGPTSARPFTNVTLSVVDGATGAAISGADVDGRGSTTDVNGKVNIALGMAGLYSFKANRPGDSIRSNGLKIAVNYSR